VLLAAYHHVCLGGLLLFATFLFFFFFFQAEDGIRDLTVTGVQTCALPIFAAVVSGSQYFIRTGWKINIRAMLEIAFPSCTIGERSEERRVGKECRSRWWADQ